MEQKWITGDIFCKSINENAIAPYAMKLLKYSPNAGLPKRFCPACEDTIKRV